MLTTYSLINLFMELNDKYFNSKLPVIPLRVSNRKSHNLGFFQWGIRRSMGLLSFNDQIKITIQNCPEHMDAAFLRHTMIHEMCHYALYLKYRNVASPRSMKRYNGHCPEFRALMESFGFNGSASHPMMPAFRKQVPAETLLPARLVPSVPAMTMVYNAEKKFRILSTGLIGTFLKETIIYGKKHIVLKDVQGCLFPFTTSVDNVVPA